MYPNYIDKLNRQKEEIENMIRSYQQMTPVNNYINTNQTPSKDLIEWRILNENEEVDNLYVSNKTLFINDNLMVLKGVDGSLEKWEIKKIYPIDKKDKKINELEEKIKEYFNLPNNRGDISDCTHDPCRVSCRFNILYPCKRILPAAASGCRKSSQEPQHENRDGSHRTVPC